jgi:tetratricopeptide (TPR) repeat protein
VGRKPSVKTRRQKSASTNWLQDHPQRTFLLLSGFLILVLYWRSFTSPFVYDDLEQIVNNPNLSTWGSFVQRFLLHPVELTTSFLGYAGSTYRPLFWFSLFIDRALWGLDAGGYHATNIALHLINSNLAFALLRRLKIPLLPAAAVCLLWLSLPINTEVVAWISGRSYALCTFFVLACLLSAFNSIRHGGWTWRLACFFAAVCAGLSHELGILILPLLLLLLLLIEEQRSKNLFATLATVALAAFAIEAARFSVKVKSFSGIASFKWASLAFSKYLALTLFPLHMSVERSTFSSPGHSHLRSLAAIACFVLAFGYAALRRRNHPALLGGLTWFLICIAPFIVLTNYQGLAERFLYLASIGIVVAIIAVCSIPNQSRLRNVLAGIVALWALWNLYRTTTRVADWADPVQLFAHSLEATPQSPSLHYNLAYSQKVKGDLHAALNEYQRTIQLDSNYPHAYASLGDVYLQLGSFSDAQTAYKQALVQAPDDIPTLLNSGTVDQSIGSTSEAEANYQRVLQLDPSSSAAHVNLGVLYMRENRSNEAAHQFTIAIDQKTKDPIPYFNLAVLYQQSGHHDQALALYKRVLELKPNDEDTLANIKLLEQTH